MCPARALRMALPDDPARRARARAEALLLLAALAAAGAARATVQYEAVFEWTGPHFRVIHGTAVDQLVDNPSHDIAFVQPYAVAAREHGTGQRDVVYVVDSGHNRVQAFEANATYNYAEQSAFTYQAGGAIAASEWDSDQIHLAEWNPAATRFVVPYSETVTIGGEIWTRIADLTGFTPADKVYRLDYSDATNAPILLFPAGSLSGSSEFSLRYVISQEFTGAAPAFGIGDVDYGIGEGASPVLTQIDQTSGGPTGWQLVRSIALIADEVTGTTDDVFLVDSADNSASQNEELFEYRVTVAGSVSYVEAYDDVLTAPYDVAVARSGASTAPTVTVSDDAGPFDQATAAVSDANQVTGHSYIVTVAGGNVTISDATTQRVLVDAALFADLANPFYGIPGLSLPKNGAAGASNTIATTRAVSNRYLFVADTGGNRIKVIGAGNGTAAAWPGSWLPGDVRDGKAQPSGAGQIGATPDHDYYYTTPATVPEDYSVYTSTFPVKQGSLETITFDPTGVPASWTRVDNLSTAVPGDKAYELDWTTGRVLFGDGIHGSIPPADTNFEFDYTTTPDILRYGSSGTGSGQFSSPKGIAARWNPSLGTYDIYVADSGNNRIQKLLFHPAIPGESLPPRMEYVAQWNTGSGPSDFLNNPVDLHVALDNQALGSGQSCFLAVADQGNNRILTYLDKAALSGGGTAVPTFDTVMGSAGNSLGQYQQISGLAFLQNGDDLDLYTADGTRGVIAKYEEAPTPSITLSFSGASLLPRCFPATSSYPFAFAITNPPVGGSVDFYYDTAPAFDPGTAQLCITSGTIPSTASSANWVFADSPGGTPADDAGYYLFAQMKNADGLTVASDQTQANERLCLDSSLVPTLSLADGIDGDRTVYLQNGLERVVELQLSYPESVVAVGFSGTFDPNLFTVTGITRGNAWDGTGATDVIFNESHSDTNGTFLVNTSVTGAPLGLSGTGPHTMALIAIKAKDTAIDLASRFRDGAISLVPGNSGITTIHGSSPPSWEVKSMHVRMAYLGDLATTGSGADSLLPHLAPKPDGQINFADQMVFTTGWNGIDHIQDRISDIGPADGVVPSLVPRPDGRWNVDDLLAFTVMFSWASAGGYQRIPAPPGGSETLTLGEVGGVLHPVILPRPVPLGGPLAGDAEAYTVSHLLDPKPGNELTLDLVVDQVRNLTGAWLNLAFDPTQLELLSVENGGFLRGRDGDLFFHRSGAGWVEISATRLDRDHPGVFGRGPLARLSFRIRETNASRLDLEYDLRSSDGAVLSRGSRQAGPFEGEPASFRLFSCQPNPARSRVTLLFSLASPTPVRLDVFDITGRRIRGLVDDALAPGYHVVPFDARSEAGEPLPSGIYLCRLQAGGLSETRKLVLAR